VTSTIVVGGGLMGASAAWHLARRGHDVTLLERFAPGHDRGSSHGTSRIFRLAYPDPLYVGLAARALTEWRRLEHETGRSVLTLTGGVDHGPDAETRPVYETLRAAGHTATWLAPAEVAERWPGLRVDGTAVFHADAGRLHADDAVAALWNAARAHGADLRPGVRVTRIVRRAGGVDVITGDEDVVRADVAVVAVGGWAPSVLRECGIPAPELRVTQEQPAHFPAADPLAWPSFIHHGGTEIYGLGSVDGVKVGLHGAGPVVDPDHRDRTVDDSTERTLAEYAARWLPGVDATHPESLTCLYTTTPDHDFVIDRHGPVVVLAGCSGHGFKFGALVGELAADLVEEKPGIPRFSLTR
jgi:sarcosine oxidase